MLILVVVLFFVFVLLCVVIGMCLFGFSIGLLNRLSVCLLCGVLLVGVLLDCVVVWVDVLFVVVVECGCEWVDEWVEWEWE